jgi:hypothetical protein
LFAVPELTRSAPIKLNKRVSLRKRANYIRLLYRTLPQRPASRSRQSRQAIIFRLAALFCSSCKGQLCIGFWLFRSSVSRLLLSCGDFSDIWPLDFGLNFDRHRTFARVRWLSWLPDNVAERCCRAHPPQGDAGDPDHRRRARRVAARTVGRSEGVATAVAGCGAQDRRAWRRQGRSGSCVSQRGGSAN